MRPPRLLRSGLTGRVYITTRYIQEGDVVIAGTKYDVTDDFEAIEAERAAERRDQRERIVEDMP